MDDRSERQGILPSSFRDPSGFVFRHDQQVYRQVNLQYQAQYDHMMSSGLYEALVKKGLLVGHEETGNDLLTGENGYKVIRPEQIPYVSYPYEWCFSQLKDAALCTIQVQLEALEHGMVLKDASAYNIQFLRGRPVLIDTLSFDLYREGEPWVAYKQFCQHFIAPLALMAHTDVRLSQLFRIHIDGPPLDLASKLLPVKTWLKYSLLSHLHLHARTQARYSDIAGNPGQIKQGRKISAFAFQALMKSIESCVQGLQWNQAATEWGDYYSATNYEGDAMDHKEQLVSDFLADADKSTPVHDLGANDGRFSRVAAQRGFTVISQDIDPVAVEKNYLQVKNANEENILPLLLDLTNPSGAIGWQLAERESFLDRCADSNVMALALIHHLAISNNVPLPKLAAFFAAIAKVLVIEFVPKEDSQVQRLLATREDIFPGYHRTGFEQAFSEYFTIKKSEPVKGSERSLYLMERR